MMVAKNPQGASPSGVSKAFLGYGFTSGERGRGVMLVSGALSFPGGSLLGPSMYACWEAHLSGRTLACVGVWIECIGESVLDLCLEHICYARTGRACCRSWPKHNSGCPWKATSGDLMLEVGINEAANVGVVYSAVSRKKSGFSVFMCEDFLSSVSVEPSSADGRLMRAARGCEVMHSKIAKAHEELYDTCDEAGEVIMENTFPFFSKVELTQVDTDQLTDSHAVVKLSFYA
eukprot:550915-Pelagomonas_calceolata.AAC.2